VYKGLKEHVGLIASTKYAFHLVTKLYNSFGRPVEILDNILSKARELMGSPEGATVLNYFHEKYGLKNKILNSILSSEDEDSENALIGKKVTSLVSKILTKEHFHIPIVQILVNKFAFALP